MKGRLVLTTSNPLFLIPQNWRDFEGEQSLEVLNQINYQIYPYYINKITNYEKTNYSPLLNFKKIQKTFFFNGRHALYCNIYTFYLFIYFFLEFY